MGKAWRLLGALVMGGALALAGLGQPAGAAEVHVLAAGAVHTVVLKLVPDYTRETGTELKFTFGPVGNLVSKLQQGTPADLIIVTPAALKKLTEAGLVATEPQVNVGQVGVGVAVKAGAPLPDISSPEALRTALLAASGVYTADPKNASSAIYFAKVMADMGIAEQVQPKLHTYRDGADSMAGLVQGDAGGIGVTMISEIKPNPQVVVVGQLPAPLALITVYAGGVTAHAAQPQAAAAFLRFLASPKAQEAFHAGGFDPVP